MNVMPPPKFLHRAVVFMLAVSLGGMHSSCSLAQDAGAVRMKVHSLQASMGSNEIAVLLTDENRQRFLPISVGGDQALSIQLGRDGRTAKRPLTHDLIANIFKSLNVEVERITITDLREGVYYAEIALRQNGRTYQIDSRPSDAIALSLRVNAPIFAMPHLLKPMTDWREDEEAPTPSPTEFTSWGMKIQPLTEALAEFFGRREGVLVADVFEKSAAAESGIRAGDIVLRLDKQEIPDLDTFLKVIAARKDSNRVEVGILRGDQNLEFVIQDHN
ncbi:MAG: hypothetical protein ALAOOOJD_02748 [bacterium]|nr:hypothetical protein [bacterium]